MSEQEFRERILSTHMIVREGGIPEAIINRLPEDRDIIKINKMGQNVVFYKEQGPNGESKSNECFEFRLCNFQEVGLERRQSLT